MDMPAHIGHYRVDREIGRGGMGVVYLARDTRLNRDVAIKVLTDKWVDQEDHIDRFKREARSLARLNHPNVAAIYGVEEQNGSVLLILEYVAGDTLADRINSGPLPIDESLELAVGIARGIEAAHAAGITHRDLKPSNIKITPEGTVKILDFGIAKDGGEYPSDLLLDGSTQFMTQSPTVPGTVIGTPQYMSPEQARGQPVDKRSDIWSFGVIFYEMLTGVRPFVGETISDIIAAVLHTEVNFDRLPSDTSGIISRVIRRSLERDVSRRLHDIADARIELEDVNSLDHLPATMQVGAEPIVNRSFRINDEVCRVLDREGLDPLILGWDLQYSDNCRDSPVLVMWVPSFGSDHTSPFHRHLMDASQHRIITPTPIGMEPGASLCPNISQENQLALLRILAQHLRETLRPKHLLIAGSSCGSITALRCVAGDESNRLFDAFLAVDPDIVEGDCFITRLFADLDPTSEGDAILAMRKISSSCETLFDWISLHEYMLPCIEKMQQDITPLILQGAQMTESYRDVHQADDSPFIPWLYNACKNTRVVRCVFPDNPKRHRLISEIRMMHLDSQSLGPCFEDGTMTFASASTHSEMLRTEHVLKCIDQVVDLL